ncbi:restriction endonuclease subunit S [Winogradskyella vidalii]|uniref:restriction endonuclease subunit S n=1 Tax=Winogradskyella vidalii TaxID=2615024 RepID=UPI0015CC4ED4|nr:restriction endonuclease subunit S [Winogradskyella vidalii]
MKHESLVPELRFPEFKGGWSIRKLDEITSKIGSGKTPKGGDEVYEKSGIPFIRSQNVINNALILDSTHIPIEIHQSMKSSTVKSDDILLNITGGSIGRSCVVPENFEEGNVNQHVSIIRIEQNSPKFFQSFLSSWRGQKLIHQGQTGSGREGLNFQSIKNFKIAFPTISEQQKIASFLSAIDKRIKLLEEKKTKLELYKIGVMQQLFNQDIRFKDDNGKDFPDWEEKRLGKISDITTGSSNRQDSGLDGEYTFFDRSEDIRTSSIFLFDGEAIIVAGEGSDFVPKYFAGKFDLHQRTYAIMNFKNSDGKFLFYNIHYYRRYFLRQAVGSTVKSLRLPMFQKMSINLPCIEEQEKIAEILSKIDESIYIISVQIDETADYKKGLLQKMFV